MLLLGQKIKDVKGRDFKMAGLLPFSASEGNLKVGYRKIKSNGNSLLLMEEQKIIGHEFHRWQLKPSAKDSFNKKTKFRSPWKIKGWEIPIKEEGWSDNFFHASWIHLHWPSSTDIINSWRKSIQKSIKKYQ